MPTQELSQVVHTAKAPVRYPLLRSTLNRITATSSAVIIPTLGYSHRADLTEAAIGLTMLAGWLIHCAYERCAVAEWQRAHVAGVAQEARRIAVQAETLLLIHPASREDLAERERSL